jgi:hypothetical protein
MLDRRSNRESTDLIEAGSNGSYGASPIKRFRRTKDEMATIRDAIYAALERDRPMTVRQLFYRLVNQKVIDKTEAQYDNTVVRLTRDLRLEHVVPFYWIADNTRWMRKPNTYSGLEQLLQETVSTYRRAVWDNQCDYVEVWLEKDALAGVLIDVTEKWDVPLMVTRGYASLSFLYEAAQSIAAENKPAFIYYFGDYDPSGVHIPHNVEQRLREFAPASEIHFKRVAVNPDQIRAWHLPTRPTKKTDTRSKNFKGESVEVDAIEPAQLRKLAEECITRHINRHAYKSLQRTEATEKQSLSNYARGFRGAAENDGEADD